MKLEEVHRALLMHACNGIKQAAAGIAEVREADPEFKATTLETLGELQVYAEMAENFAFACKTTVDIIKRLNGEQEGAAHDQPEARPPSSDGAPPREDRGGDEAQDPHP